MPPSDEDAVNNSAEEVNSGSTSYDEGTLQEEHKEEEYITGSDRRTSSTLLNAELSAMITLLRKQMSSARFFSDTSPIAELLDEFGKTRTKTMDPRRKVGCKEGIEPFIKLFRSVDVTGQIVLGALESVRRLLFSSYFPVLPDYKSYVEAYRELFDSISRCRFEATDLNMDEIALLKLTGTLLDGLRHPMAAILTNEQVCTAVETTFRLCFQSRFSEMMRQSSCFVAIGIVQYISCQLPRLLKAGDFGEEGKLKAIALPFAKVADGVAPATPAMETKSADDGNLVVVKSPPLAPEKAPYRVATLVEILSFLAKLLDGARLDDRGRCLAADAIGTFIEMTRAYLPSCPALMKTLSDSVCRNMILLVNVNSSPQVLRHLIHPLGAMFRLYRRQFASQFGCLVEKFVDTLRAAPSANPRMMARFIEIRTVLLEFALEFMEDRDLLVDLYAHYECDMRYSMLFSELIGCLCELAGNFDGKMGGSEATAMLALQMMNRMLFELSLHGKNFKMAGGSSTMVSPVCGSGSPFVDQSESRRTKQIVQEAALYFNKKPKEGIALLQRQGLLSEEANPADLVKFLRQTPLLDKKVLGEFLAKEGNEEILRSFLSDFNFQLGETIDMALRKVLESFRLPGEAQQIDRVVEAFAAVYFESVGKDSSFANQDATHVLAFSIIMLNTDLYNPQNQRRMTLEEFIKNNRGINDGADFDHELLRHIYKEISEREIVLPEEVQSAEYAWMQVLSRADSYAKGLDAMPSLAAAAPGSYLTGIVGLLFGQFQACFLAEGSRPEALLNLSYAGIEMMSQVLSDLELHPLMAELIEALWQATGIPAQMVAPAASGPSPKLSAASQPASPAPPANSQQSSAATRAKTVRHVAKSETCQRPLRTLFSIVQASGPTLRAGWRTVCTALFAFADAGLLHLEMVDPGLSEEIKKTTSLEVKPGTPLDPISGAGNGILSAFSSYIVSSSPESAESEREQYDPELKKRALQVIREACQLDRILQETRYFQADSLHALLQALSQGLLFSANSPGAVEKPFVIVLELLVYVGWQNRDRLAMFWPLLSSCLADLAKLPHRRLCEHSVMGLGRICLWLADRPVLPAGSEDFDVLEGPPPLYLQVLCHVPPETFEYIAEPATALALRIVEAAKAGSGLSPQVWPHYFTLLSRASRFRSCDASTYGLLSLLIPKSAAEPLLLPLEFFSEYLDLLATFIGNTVDVSPGKETTPLSLASKESLPPSTLSEQALVAATTTLESLAELQKRLVHNDWATYILPLHSEIAAMCTHRSRILRQHCLSLLQRLILSLDYAHNASSREVLPRVFHDVLLPLLTSLQVLTEADRRVIEAIEETQMRAASILCKIFLQNLPLLLEALQQDFLALWQDLLRALLALMEGRSDILRESVPESVKNMLMVMATSGPLASQETDEAQAFWKVTWEMLDPVIPRLHQDLTALTGGPPEPIQRSGSIDSSSSAKASEDKSHPADDGEDEEEDAEELEDDKTTEDHALSEDDTPAEPGAPSDDSLPSEAEVHADAQQVNGVGPVEAASEEEAPLSDTESSEEPSVSKEHRSMSMESDRPTTMFEV